MLKYEEVLDTIRRVSSASTGDIRDISWLTPAEVVGIARDRDGRLEVFLKGGPLRASSSALREALQHHEWHRTTRAPLPANRLLLPALGHFDSVAAFIATELLSNGADQDLEQAFRAIEPIIEITIERLLLSQSALLGLAGELLLLNAICHQADNNLVGALVQAWDGWRRSSRDFHWQGTGAEVKTTMRASSTHSVQGVHQVELSLGEDDRPPEDRLFLVSVGLQHVDSGPNSISVPVLVDRIVERLRATGYQSQISEFLTRVGRYGTESGFGYDHATMQNDAPFTSSFTIVFFRAYDMSDQAIEVIRTDDLAPRHHVDLPSVSFRITLPATLSARNPVAGLNQVAHTILRI